MELDRYSQDRWQPLTLSARRHRMHGVDLQLIASPDGTILWVSGHLPGSSHDTAAARI